MVLHQAVDTTAAAVSSPPPLYLILLGAFFSSFLPFLSIAAAAEYIYLFLSIVILSLILILLHCPPARALHRTRRITRKKEKGYSKFSSLHFA